MDSTNKLPNITEAMMHAVEVGTENEPIPPERMIDPSLLRDVEATTGVPLSQAAPTQPTQPEPTPSIPSFLTPDEARQLGVDGAGERVNTENIEERAAVARAEKAATHKDRMLADLLDSKLEEEKENVARAEKMIADEDTRKELLGSNDPSGSVQYNPNHLDGAETADTERTAIASEGPDVVDELIPSYDYTDADERPDTGEVTRPTSNGDPTTAPDPNNVAEYSKYIKDLTVIDFSLGDEIVDVVREKGDVVTSVPSNRGRARVMGDQAFNNSVNKFKKDNFRIVRVPLVNSGFFVDMVGTGAIDLTLLYDQTTDQTTDIEYDLEKMRLIIRGVVDTMPKIDKNDLRNMIHYADYQMMAYAHMVATLATVELVVTCTECGRDFRVHANSEDLIINKNELQTRKEAIQSAASINDYSLMVRNRQLTTPDGFQLTLGHPSYAEYVQYLNEFQTLMKQLTRGQSRRIAQLAEVMPYVRTIRLPNGVSASNLYQRFIAVTMLNDASFLAMRDEIMALTKQILVPTFGIRKVTCPHCGKVNSDISYSDLNDLLFFHITVNRLLNAIEQSSVNG